MASHSIRKDLALGLDGHKAFGEAIKITETAVMVVKVLHGYFTHIQSGTTFYLSGMSADQRKKFVNALHKGNFGL